MASHAGRDLQAVLQLNTVFVRFVDVGVFEREGFQIDFIGKLRVKSRQLQTVALGVVVGAHGQRSYLGWLNETIKGCDAGHPVCGEKAIHIGGDKGIAVVGEQGQLGRQAVVGAQLPRGQAFVGFNGLASDWAVAVCDLFAANACRQRERIQHVLALQEEPAIVFGRAAVCLGPLSIKILKTCVDDHGIILVLQGQLVGYVAVV